MLGMDDFLTLVVAALRRVRIRRGHPEERHLHDVIATSFSEHGIPFERECRLGPRRRVDFLVGSYVAVEIKKGRPARTPTLGQLEGYALDERVRVLILVAERGIPDLPEKVAGKQLLQVSLNASWGIAVS